MARLFELMEAIENCFKISEEEVVDTETGEVLDIEYLNNLEIKKEQLTKYLLQKVLNEDSDAKAYKEQKDVFAKKQKAAENRRDALKAYLSSCLNGEAFEADDKSVKATFRKSVSVEVDDLDILRDEFKTVKTEVKADKTAIKKAIQSGVPVEGARLVEGQSIQIK